MFSFENKVALQLENTKVHDSIAENLDFLWSYQLIINFYTCAGCKIYTVPYLID